MAFLVIGLAVALVGLVACLTRLAKQRRRFSAIVDVDAEVARLRSAALQEAERLKAAAVADVIRLKDEGQRHRREAQETVAQAQAEDARRELLQWKKPNRSSEQSGANATSIFEASFDLAQLIAEPIEVGSNVRGLAHDVGCLALELLMAEKHNWADMEVYG